MKETPLDYQGRELVFNKQLMQYQIFIKSQPASSALEKTFFSCKIKTKSVLNIKAATKSSSPKPTVYTTNNK